MASASTAWALWALTGLFGGHLFYLGRPRQGLLALFSLNLFIFGWIRDAVQMKQYLSAAQPPPKPDTPTQASTQKLLSVGASPAPRFPTGSVSGSAHRPSPASSRNGDADPVEVVSIDGTRSGMGTAGGVAGSASVGTDCVDVSLDDDGAGVEPAEDVEGGEEPHEGSHGRKKSGLDGRTIEWVARMKAESAQAEQKRREELASTLTPEELEERMREEKLEAERKERQVKLLKKQLQGYSALRTPSKGRGRPPPNPQ